MQKIANDQSHNPMAWQRAADILTSVGQTLAGKICHETAGNLMRDANANDLGVVELEVEEVEIKKP